MSYKFNPLEHGYAPMNTHPELEYAFPTNNSDWFIKVVAGNRDETYWYSALCLNIGLGDDDRVKIFSSLHTMNKNNDRNIIHTKYMGLISSDAFAKELLKHLFGTTRNDSVETIGLKRYEGKII